MPRFCFHERLSVAGNCRMCLVEVKGGPPKPTASCAMAVKDLRPGPKGEPPVVETNSPMVRKARQGVMEFLLINHPLDCPICDQGGECDLQDQAMGYGVDSSRFAENKRAVEDKYIGALVKTSMNRCIHCTRCVRFATEVAGVSELGAIGRGEDMEITTYLERAMTSELQGNVVDLCPVGALTSKPTAFHARPWEYAKTESVDVMDALGSAIRIDSRGREVVRILPRVNEAINEEWISDKTRHVVDGLKTQRLDRPYVRVDGKLEAGDLGARPSPRSPPRPRRRAPARIGAIVGDLASVEEMFALKGLMDKLGAASVDCRQDGSKLDPKFGRASYLFNSTIAGIDEADAIMIIGSNPRLEAPVLNARIRKRWLKGDCLIGVDRREGRPDLRLQLSRRRPGRRSPHFAEHPPANKAKPMFILGAGALRAPRRRGGAVARRQGGAVARRRQGRLERLQRAARRGVARRRPRPRPRSGRGRARRAGDGARPARSICSSTSAPTRSTSSPAPSSSTSARMATAARIAPTSSCPAPPITEKTGIYVNTEGRPQFAERAVFPPGDAREDWAILRALSDALGARLPFDSLAALRAALAAAHPASGRDTTSSRRPTRASSPRSPLAAARSSARRSPRRVADFYLTNPIARASRVMAECSALRARASSPQAAE